MCPYCSAEFKTNEELEEHLAIEHPEAPPVASLQVRVFDSYYEPVKDRLVQVGEAGFPDTRMEIIDGREAYTDAKGQAFFGGLPLGEIYIKVTAQPYPLWRRITLSEGLNTYTIIF